MRVLREELVEDAQSKKRIADRRRSCDCGCGLMEKRVGRKPRLWCGGCGPFEHEPMAARPAQGAGTGRCCASDEEFLKEFCIPNYICNPGDQQDTPQHAPRCPVVVFINSKSGGQLGGELLKTSRKLLNTSQVFDLEAEAPDKVLDRIYRNLERLKHEGDHLAIEIEKSLRLIVAGGDGTASWLLGILSDKKLRHPPPVATVPLGTGNNIHFSFGWGKKNPGTDCLSVKRFLDQVSKAREMKIDSWHIIVRMKAPAKGSCDPIPPLELPHSLHAFRRVSNTDALNMEGYNTYRGGFWNYFSMGMDAQVSYAFHSKRKMHPERFKSQLVNQSTYLKLGFSQGWFYAPLVQDLTRNIAQLTKVRIIRKPGGDWVDLHIPQRIRSIVCLNLPSFSGGLNPWGTPSKRKSRDRYLTPALVDDGLLEIVGFRDAWHGLLLLSPKGHGTRLAQAHRVHFEFCKGPADETYMRLDGEPWKQPLPKDDDTVVVEISHLGQVKMLATGNCRSKSIAEVMSVASIPNHTYDDLDPSEESEERRKFGAADTFKFQH